MYKVIHLNAIGIEERIQFHIVACLCRATNPLAVADHEIAKLATRIQFVEHTVSKVWPGYKFEMHLVSGFCFKILGKLDQCIGRVPGRPTQGQVLGLRI